MRLLELFFKKVIRNKLVNCILAKGNDFNALVYMCVNLGKRKKRRLILIYRGPVMMGSVSVEGNRPTAATKCNLCFGKYKFLF